MKQNQKIRWRNCNVGTHAVSKSVRLFCEQKVIDEAKADAYVYGYELLISSVVSVLLVVLIAVVCGDVRYALSF